MIVAVDRIHFLVDVGDEQILPAVLIEIGGIDAHAGAFAPVLTVGHAGAETHLFKFSVVLVHEKEICDRVVGDEEIHPTVVVHVRGNHAPGFTERFADAGFLSDVGKGAIAIVVKEPAFCRLVDARNAVVAFAFALVSAKFIFRFIEIDKAANEQVQLAVIVVVEPDRAGGPAGSGDSGLLSHIGERAITIVVVQDAAAVLRDVQIWKAVAIVICDSDAHAVAAARYAGLFGDVGEGAIAIVAV